jgi:hypothetical protein
VIAPRETAREEHKEIVMNMAKSAAIAAGLALCLGTGSASAQQTAQTNTGERPIDQRPIRPNRVLLGAGGAIVAASYIPALVVAIESDRDGDGWLYAPVIGPWADLIDREGCGAGCGYEALNKALLIGAGVAHLAGVGAIVASFLVPERETRIATPAAAKASKPEVHVAPIQIGKNGYGLGVGGRF